jgi:hypothetical protein
VALGRASLARGKATLRAAARSSRGEVRPSDADRVLTLRRRGGPTPTALTSTWGTETGTELALCTCN